MRNWILGEISDIRFLYKWSDDSNVPHGLQVVIL